MAARVTGALFLMSLILGNRSSEAVDAEAGNSRTRIWELIGQSIHCWRRLKLLGELRGLFEGISNANKLMIELGL